MKTEHVGLGKYPFLKCLFKGRHKRNLSLKLSPGEVVEVRSESEILSTLDENGSFEELPFTPEMRKYCGTRFKILKRVNKINVEEVGMRRTKNMVILEGVTCNGEAHGGCDRACPLIWKDAWLKRAQNDYEVNVNSDDASMPSDLTISKEETFSCQATNLVRASSAPLWDIQQHVWETSLRERGKFKPLKFIHMLLSSLSFKVRKLSGMRNRSILPGTLKRTPTASLSLQPGELVEVKSKEEILATLDFNGRNRGLIFDPEMQKYCGGRFRVLKRIDKMINEETGQMRQIAKTVILEGVVCEGEFHGGCQRNCYCLWREIWLRRV